MATSRTPANQRQRTWRAQAAQPEQRARRRRVFRVLLPVVGVCLLGLLAWVFVVWFLRPPKLDLIAVAVAEYRNPEVPPIPYCYEDLEALRASLAAEDTKNSSLLGEASSEGIARLRTALEETSNSHDNVLIYIKAHGVSINGSAFLLGGDFELRGSAGRVLINDLLADVQKSPANIKLLVLDTGHLDSDPRMGMLTNEFTDVLKQAVAAMPSKANVWVLTSNSLFERAQVSLKDQRSAFSYYLAEGLKGQADGIFADKDKDRAADRLIQLDELYTYVREHVIQYARLTSSDRQSQTPMLLHSGRGELTDPPAADLMRVSITAGDEKKEVAVQMTPSGTASSLWKLGSSSSLAIASQDVAVPGESKTAGTSSSQPTASETGDTTAGSAEKTAESASKEAAKATSSDSKDTKTIEEKTSPASSKDETKAAVKDDPQAAKNRTKPESQQPVRKRSTLEQSLFKFETWLQERQSREQLWRPVDYAPDLARLYYESLAGCRQRALAGHLFLDEPEYRSSLQQKLSELGTLQTSLDSRSDRFVKGLARPSYERYSDVRNAIRARNEACYLLPILIAHHARLSENTEPTMQRDLAGLISATRELDRLLAAQPGPSEVQRAFDGWKRQIIESTGRIRGHLSALQTDFDDRCNKQKRNIDAEGNQTVSRALADLATSPLATPQQREQLQDLAGKSARSFSEVEKQGSARMRRPLASEQQQWNQLGWQRARQRAELELDLVAFGLSDAKDGKLTELRKSLNSSAGLTDTQAAVLIARSIDEYLSAAYRRAPDRLRDQLATNRYDLWRAAETEIRLIDVRDQKRVERELNNRSGRAWSDPIAGVPLQTLPQLTKSYRLVLGETANSAAEPLALNYQTPEKLILRFESNTPLPERLRLKLAYDDLRVELRGPQGTELKPGKVWEFQVGGGSENSTTEYRLELAIASRDERGDRSNLAFTWFDSNDQELFRVATDLLHPEPQFVQLDVYGERFTAAHNWQPAGKEWRFEAPFSNKGLAQVRLQPFPGQDTHYNFRLTNGVKTAKKFSAVVYSIPPADEADSDRSPESLARAAQANGKELARSEISIGPLGTAPIPFFNAAPPAAVKEPPAAGNNGKAADDKATAKPPEDVSEGMVCVLTDVTKPADGRDVPEPRRQMIVIEIETQLPQNYITPRVNYTTRPGELGEIAVKLDPDIDRLPPAGARVQLEVVSSEPGEVAQPPGATREALVTRQDLDGKILRQYVKTGTGRAQVFLHVDGYPRAFIYELPLDATLPNVVRKLVELRRIKLPDPRNFQVYYPGRPAELVGFPFEVDMPPSRDRTYVARLFIDGRPGGETFDRREDKLVLERFEDRDHHVALVEQKGVPGMALRSQVSDFTAKLDLLAFSDNQQVHVRVQLLKRDRGIESVLGTPDDRADKTLILYLDKQPPTLDAKGPANSVYENDDVLIDLEAHDEVSGVKTVQFATKVQASPDAKTIDDKVLVEPMPVPQLGANQFRLLQRFEKAGIQTLWFQAIDMAGNKSELKSVSITVNKAPTAAGAPVGPKTGKITGRAVLPDGARGAVKEVILSDAAGSALKTSPPAEDGSFAFDKLAPGQYTLDSKGIIGGNNSKPNPKKVTVEAGKTTNAGQIELGR